MGSFEQEMLGCGMNGMISIDTNVDIVFVIDATGSMQPLIDKVKSLTLSFRGELEAGLAKNRRRISALRIKVIVFRDYYVDDRYAMQESRFFVLPEEAEDFHRFVSEIKAGGGGDEPESSLEALALAMRSDFVTEGDKRRHVIVLFTDASAHRLEQSENGVPENYPKDMFRSLGELYRVWGSGQDNLAGRAPRKMDREAKRLVLFAPKLYPWHEMSEDLENVLRCDLSVGAGGSDLDLSDVIALIANSIA